MRLPQQCPSAPVTDNSSIARGGGAPAPDARMVVISRSPSGMSTCAAWSPARSAGPVKP